VKSASRTPNIETNCTDTGFFLGDTAVETLKNIEAVLQVLADASQYPGHSESSAHGTWLILQSLAATARCEVARLGHGD
jgi:hypothetical protein